MFPNIITVFTICTDLVVGEQSKGDPRGAANVGHKHPTPGFADMALVHVKNGSTNHFQNFLGKTAYKNCEYQNKRCYKKYSIDHSSFFIDKETW